MCKYKNGKFLYYRRGLNGVKVETEQRGPKQMELCKNLKTARNGHQPATPASYSHTHGPAIANAQTQFQSANHSVWMGPLSTLPGTWQKGWGHWTRLCLVGQPTCSPLAGSSSLPRRRQAAVGDLCIDAYNDHSHQRLEATGPPSCCCCHLFARWQSSSSRQDFNTGLSLSNKVNVNQAGFQHRYLSINQVGHVTQGIFMLSKRDH